MLAPPRPPAPELEDLIPEARERQRRRRLVAAASLASAAGLILVVHALPAGSGTDGRTARSGGVSAPNCRASQLAFSAFTGAGPSMSGSSTQAYLANTGSRACALPTGMPTATFSVSGNVLSATQKLMPPPYSAFGPRAGRILLPGRKYYYVLTFGNLCPRGIASNRVPSKLQGTIGLRFSDGLRLSAQSATPENNGRIVPECGTFELSPLLRWPS